MLTCDPSSRRRANGGSAGHERERSWTARIRGWALAATIGASLTAVPAQAQTTGQRAQMVVELYTSQGCTQCPRANRLLGMFSHEEGVLTLTFPVGIWDYLGWTDTFARPQFADRQRAYSQALRVRGRFTPQLVFNGARQISAADWDEARQTFETMRSEGWPEGAPAVSISRLRNNHVRVTIAPAVSVGAADVWIVAYDPGPLTVLITSGLNRNRNVTHYNLVRSVDRLGAWSGSSVWFERARCQPECAVLVQEPNGGRVLAGAFTVRPQHH